MGLFLFVSVLMTIEYVMQQLRIRQIKGGMDDLRNEITELKAKLYDKSVEQTDEEEEQEDEDDDEGNSEEEIQD